MCVHACVTMGRREGTMGRTGGGESQAEEMKDQEPQTRRSSQRGPAGCGRVPGGDDTGGGGRGRIFFLVQCISSEGQINASASAAAQMK